MLISKMMRQNSGGKAKWKMGLQKLRRQSTVSEFSNGDLQASHSLMDEEPSEDEMQDYLARLKKKTGLNQLWSGRKFEEAIDKDPDIDLSEEPKLRSGTLKDLTLDSDEEDLRKFIHNLTDGEDDVISEQEEPPQTASSKSDFNLMKNINFAEPTDSAYGKLQVDTDDEKDYIPVIGRPNLAELSSEKENAKNSAESSSSDIFRNANINFVGSEVSSVEVDKGNKSDDTLKSVLDEDDTELSEEIPELQDMSRVNTPLAKSADYTGSKFESYSSVESSVISPNQTPRKETKERKVEKRTKGESSRSSSSKSSVASHSSTHERRKVKGKGSQGYSESRSHSKSMDSTTSSSRSASTSSSSSSSKTKTSEASKPTRPEKKHSKKIVSEKRDKIKSSRTQQRVPKIGLQDLRMDEAMLENIGAVKYLDPSPIAGTVVSDEALEAVTAYNPTLLALNDLLKYQLQLTRQHIDNSWRLYRAYTEPDAVGKHKYTTLKQTMKYIKKHAPPVVSYKDALKQVQEGDDL